MSNIIWHASKRLFFNNFQNVNEQCIKSAIIITSNLLLTPISHGPICEWIKNVNLKFLTAKTDMRQHSTINPKPQFLRSLNMNWSKSEHSWVMLLTLLSLSEVKKNYWCTCFENKAKLHRKLYGTYSFSSKCCHEIFQRFTSLIIFQTFKFCISYPKTDYTHQTRMRTHLQRPTIGTITLEQWATPLVKLRTCTAQPFFIDKHGSAEIITA